MKRTAKIAIKRQTLRALTDDAAASVAGGGFTHNYKCTGDTVESHGPSCGTATICQTYFHC
jgi:hypothetical protein